MTPVPKSADLPDFRGNRVTLRLPLDTDVDPLVRLPIDPEIVRMYGAVHTGSTARTREGAAQTVAWMRAQPLLWVIDAGGYLGHVRLHDLQEVDRRASLAIGLDDATRLGQGLGPEAMRLILCYAFGALKLHRVSLRVLSFNVRAIRAYETVGFVREGVERQSARVGDTWHDDVMMGLLAAEFGASGLAATSSIAQRHHVSPEKAQIPGVSDI